jgi:hypothetical protein
MAICNRCNGTGFQYLEEDGKLYDDICYHCSKSGLVDADTERNDKLEDVAYRLAYWHVAAIRDQKNLDPNEKDWNTCAAENMLNPHDYFQMMVYDHENQFMKDILNLDFSTQNILIAWNNFIGKEDYFEFENSLEDSVPNATDTIPHSHMDVWGTEDDPLLY